MAGNCKEMDFVRNLPIHSETLLKLTTDRLKLSRHRREIQMKRMRREIADFLESGEEEAARNRVEQITREEKMIAAQGMVQLFCELITVRLPLIEALRECPLGLKEAISSVCFAAPKLADLPELLQVQILFAGKYGEEFVSSATELMPECGVNQQVVELLSTQALAPDVKLKLLKEVAEEHRLNWYLSASKTKLLKTHEGLMIWPDDVIEEILLRLPVKTLLQFKCVCKHWHALIGSPRFINRHYGHESNQEHLLIQHGSYKYGFAYAMYVDETLSGYEEPEHLQMPVGFFDLMGPLNGIYCVVSGWMRLALLNPAMRQFKPLPLYPNIQPDQHYIDEVVGFGLDPLNGDYKVVSIQYFENEEVDGPNHLSLVSVYNSNSDCWRVLDDVDLINSSHFARKSLCNTYLNGVYYWAIKPDDREVAILAFDMSTDKFHKIQLPGAVNKTYGKGLALCGDSLALLLWDLKEASSRFEVWIMKNEGCWIKSFKVGPFPDVFRPLGFWKNNGLLLLKKHTLALCSVSTNKLRALEAPRKVNGIYGPFSYKESLVSIKEEGDNCELWDTSSDLVKDFFGKSPDNITDEF